MRVGCTRRAERAHSCSCGEPRTDSMFLCQEDRVFTPRCIHGFPTSPSREEARLARALRLSRLWYVCVPTVATDNIFIGLRDAQVQRNLRRKQMMLDYRPLRQYYKHKIAQATSADERLDWHRRLQRLPRDSAPTRYRNRCHICGRARGYFRFFGLCRHHVLDMVRNAMFPGFTKAEW